MMLGRLTAWRPALLLRPLVREVLQELRVSSAAELPDFRFRFPLQFVQELAEVLPPPHAREIR